MLHDGSMMNDFTASQNKQLYLSTVFKGSDGGVLVVFEEGNDEN